MDRRSFVKSLVCLPVLGVFAQMELAKAKTCFPQLVLCEPDSEQGRVEEYLRKQVEALCRGYINQPATHETLEQLEDELRKSFSAMEDILKVGRWEIVDMQFDPIVKDKVNVTLQMPVEYIELELVV